MMPAFALYRLPGRQEYVEVRQNDGGVHQLPSYSALSGARGFVIAPFSISASCPLMVISPDVCLSHPVPEFRTGSCCDDTFTKEKEAYIEDFDKFHGSLTDGTFQKIVLSRSSETHRTGNITDRDIFFRACALYPNLFVALVSAPCCGTWLMATPEILIEGDGSHWRTMALAGTMRNGSDIEWSEKNRREQKYVEDYIGSRLSPYVGDMHIDGPYTSHAGNLVHLRSDFTFTLRHPELIGDVIDCLHPTPAVCGLPKEKTLAFIQTTEHSPRLYYSGFSGMLDARGETHLFVSLRCMNITPERFRLYAGGGLLDASTAEKEWLETEAKMETMKRCII